MNQALKENTSGAMDDLPSDLDAVYGRPIVPGSAFQESFTEEDDLLKILSELGDGPTQGKVSIFKYSAKSGEREYCCKKSSVEFQQQGLDWLAATFGHGRYELVIYDSRSKITARRKISISEAAAKLHQETADPAGSTDKLAQVMLAGFQELGKLIAGRADQGAGEDAMISRMLKYKELFGGGEKSARSEMDMLRSAVSLVKDLQPRDPEAVGGGVDLLGKLVDTFGPVVADAVKDHIKNPPALPAPSKPTLIAGSENPAPVVRQPSPDHKPIATNDNMKLFIKMKLAELCSAAVQNNDPAPYAETIIDQLPVELLERLIYTENYLDVLASYHPEVVKYSVWFDELKTCVLESVEERKGAPGPDTATDT